jgi:Holliday junction resolvase RusA-like endonuclease
MPNKKPYIKLDIKPMSVNKAWQGRRFKTQEYKDYENTLLMLLPNTVKIGKNKLKLTYHYGFSSKASDIDNPCKLVTDILQKKYGFNDSQVYELVQYKEIVSKGEEYIKILVENID